MDQPTAYLPDVTIDIIAQPPDLTGGEDRINSSALQLHRQLRTDDGDEQFNLHPTVGLVIIPFLPMLVE